MVLHCTLFSLPTSILYWGAQNWTQYFKCGLTNAKKRESSASLDLLVTFLLMQPKILLAFLSTGAQHCFMLNLVSTRTPRSFSAKPLSILLTPSIYLCIELLFPRCRTLHFIFLNVMRFLSHHFSSLLRSLWMAARLSSASLYPIIQTATDHWDTMLVTGLQLDFVPLITTL